jgi:IclR family transcriptional regulator, KDG regulon repressor
MNAIHIAEKSSAPVKSAGRVLDIFETLSDEPRGLGLSELAARLEIANSSAHALVQTLLARGYLRRDRKTKRYALGVKLVQLGLAVTDDLDVRTVARGVLESLVEDTHESAFMAQLDGVDLVYVEKVVSQHRPFRMDPWLSAHVPLHCSSLGKAILAAASSEQTELLVGSEPLVRSTSNSIISRRALEADLELTRERGYSLDHQESMLGVCCAGAPVRDRTGGVIAAVSTSTICDLFDADRLGPAVAGAAMEISEALGWEGTPSQLFRPTRAAA